MSKLIDRSVKLIEVQRISLIKDRCFISEALPAIT